MYTINNQINNQAYDKLIVQKLVKTAVLEILSISLEDGAIFPKHISPTNAELIVLEGEVIFYIDSQTFCLRKHEHFSIPKETGHWVKANENSKFLIIRK